MLSATVRNQGNGRSASTTLRYYHSLDDDFYGRYGSRHRCRGQPYRSRIERPVDQPDCPVDRWNLLLRCLPSIRCPENPLPGTTAPVP